MPTITEIRQQYPQYNDMSDQQLADNFHAKFYSDMPKEEFYSKVGLGSAPVQQQSVQQSAQQLLPSSQNIGARALQDILAGATMFGQGIHNAPYQISKALGASPETLNSRFMPKPTYEDWGKYYGVTNPNIVDKLVQGAVQYAPYALAAPLTGLGSVGGGALAGGVGGATQTSHPITEGALGATLGAAGGAIKPLKEWVKNSPDKISSDILNELSGGISSSSKTPLEDTAKDVAKNIKSLYETRKQVGSQMYDEINKAVGNDKIYKTENVFSPTKDLSPSLLTKESSYRNEESELLPNFEKSMDKLHNKFISNPTYKNAQEYQSALGKRIGEIKSSYDKTEAEKDALPSYISSWNNIRQDMSNFLGRNDPKLQQLYNDATTHWKENIAPFYETNSLRNIATGKETNPQNILNIFKSPSPEFQNIARELPSEIKNKILFSVLGKSGNTSAKNVLKKFNTLDTQKLGSYITPQIESSMEALENALNKRESIKKLASEVAGPSALAALGGYEAAKHLF